jgi:hypothetical protein
MNLRPIIAAAIFAAATVPALAADAKIRSLDDDAKRGADGKPYRHLVVQASIKDRDQGIVMSLDIQARDATQVRYISVGAGQGARWMSSASSGATAYWAYRVDLDGMTNPRLSYRATLVDRATGKTVHVRTKGLNNQGEWAAANATADKLSVVQDTSYIGPGF